MKSTLNVLQWRGRYLENLLDIFQKIMSETSAETEANRQTLKAFLEAEAQSQRSASSFRLFHPTLPGRIWRIHGPRSYPTFRIDPNDEEALKAGGVDLPVLGFFTYLSLKVEQAYGSAEFLKRVPAIKTRADANQWFVDVYRDLPKALEVINKVNRQQTTRYNLNDSDEFGDVWAFAFFCHLNGIDVTEANYQAHRTGIQEISKNFSLNKDWRSVHDFHLTSDVTKSYLEAGTRAFAITTGRVDSQGNVHMERQPHMEMESWSNIGLHFGNASIRYPGGAMGSGGIQFGKDP